MCRCFRPRTDVVLLPCQTKLQLGSAKTREKHDFSSDVVPIWHRLNMIAEVPESCSTAELAVLNSKFWFRRRAAAMLLPYLISEVSLARQKHDFWTGPQINLLVVSAVYGADRQLWANQSVIVMTISRFSWAYISKMHPLTRFLLFICYCRQIACLNTCDLNMKRSIRCLLSQENLQQSQTKRVERYGAQSRLCAQVARRNRCYEATGLLSMTNDNVNFLQKQQQKRSLLSPQYNNVNLTQN